MTDLSCAPTRVSFADLTHTGSTVDANYFPLGCAFVAAYAAKVLDGRISVSLHKYPDAFAESVARAMPAIACFSNYSWSFNLCLEHARRLKARAPGTIVIFGGPNYPSAANDQDAFLAAHPDIDFHIDGDGEIPLAGLLEALLDHGLDAQAVKQAGLTLAGVHYRQDGIAVLPPPPPRLKDIDVIPSPYLTGLLDTFFDDRLTPLMQSSRGCPYACTYCHDGIDYMSKLARFPQERVLAEIDYIFAHHRTRNLLFADDNFGIFKEDVDVARHLADLQARHGWPAAFNASSAKNNKKRLHDIAAILGRSYTVLASVQSTDPVVLKEIKRANVPWDQMVELVAEVAKHGSVKSSEVILSLPLDTRDKHIKSVLDLIDLGMDEIRMYQLILLPGTDIATPEARRRFGYETRFRVMPRCVGTYKMFGEDFSAYEHHEVCVGHDTLPHAEYKQCRQFNLIIEIFSNGAVFRELTDFLEGLGIARSKLMLDLFTHRHSCPDLVSLIAQFEADEDSNFWTSEAAMKSALAQAGTVERYVAGELGTNQLLRTRMLAHLKHFDAMLEYIFTHARALVEAAGAANPDRLGYLDELKMFIALQRSNLLALDESTRQRFHFDFLRLKEPGFSNDPMRHHVADGMDVVFGHDAVRLEQIQGFLRQFGSTAEGLGHMAQRGIPIWNFYKSASRA
jgi:radical SAM superfamily enzyme YgiQ (UPF0313 family)